MKFIELPLAGAYIVEVEPIYDERGFFARTWSQGELTDRGLSMRIEQCSISSNIRSGTIRGLHYQLPPAAETKFVSCPTGAIYDVLVDVRPGSPTYLHWHAEHLDAQSHRALYIPDGVAHGFQTLMDHTVVFYMISATFDQSRARGLRWNDPELAIHWPMEPTCISARDRAFPLIAR
jgi:dTDP-4-dehydrorhamnose 3,5-epimerase